jgi:hypothetical protein
LKHLHLAADKFQNGTEQQHIPDQQQV